MSASYREFPTPVTGLSNPFPQFHGDAFPAHTFTAPIHYGQKLFTGFQLLQHPVTPLSLMP